MTELSLGHKFKSYKEYMIICYNNMNTEKHLRCYRNIFVTNCTYLVTV